jgi:ATP-dependent Clp protease ATP-binding subunit ClpB
MEQVRGHFRPEFLNRIDEIILFRRLGRDQMAGIVRIQMARFEKLLADRRLTLSLDDSAYAPGSPTRATTRSMAHAR